MDGYAFGDTLHLGITNLNELYELIETAQTQMEALSLTLQKLNTYEVNIKFTKD